MAKKVTKDMIITEVLDIDQSTAAIFMKHGMHCIGCPVASSEKISEAAVVHGIDADKLIDDLNGYLESKKA